MIDKITSNAMWIIGCHIFQAIIALIINMITARYLGPSKYGLITYAASLVAFAMPITLLGMNNTLVKEIVDNPDKEGEILGSSIFFSLISSIVCIIGTTSFAFVINSQKKEYVLVCFLYSIILSFYSLNLIQYWFQAKYKSKYVALISLFAYIVVTIYKICLVLLSKSIYWFAIANAFDFAIISIGGICFYKKQSSQKLSVSLATGKKVFEKSKHYIIASLMVVIFAQTDKIMITCFMGDEWTGYYGAAFTTSNIFAFVFYALIDSFRPSIFESIEKGYNVFKTKLATLYSIIVYLSTIQCIICTAFSWLIIRILYGEKFSESTITFQIVVWYTMFSYIGSVRNIWIISENKQKYLWRINFLGAITNIILNLLLIPALGINGAALGTLITQFYTNVLVGYILKPIRPNNAILIEGLKIKYFIDWLIDLKKQYASLIIQH